jgi:hypothetical protein
MRGTKAKRLRQAAAVQVTQQRIRETVELAPRGGGVSRYLSGVRRIYQDSKRRPA